MSTASTHRPKKHFGQNFLIDLGVIHRILQTLPPASNPSERWLEIGPGLGALTQHLLPQVKQLTVVEKDRDVIPILRKNIADLGTCEIIQHDVLTLPATQLLPTPTHVVGNLPYQITSPLLFLCFANRHNIIDMHFMVQKEVALRLCAQPGDRQHGRLSIMAQYYCQTQHCFDVPPEAFDPAPKVHSSFIQLIPHPAGTLQAENPGHFATWVQLAFQQKRKKMRNTLKKHMDAIQSEKLTPWADQRPEMLSVHDFIALSNLLGEPQHIQSR